MSKDQKYVNTSHLNHGEFHRQEWAILGSTDEATRTLASQLIRRLAQPYQLAYADADPKAGRLPIENSALVYTAGADYHRYELAADWNAFQRRSVFAAADGVLVNGNHFRAKRQIVILDASKADQLRQKLAQLTDVALILTTPEQPKPYDFLREHLGERRPILMPAGDVNGMLQWLRAQLTAARAPLYGLVLTGGKSRRMGTDKSLLDYHGMPQRAYVHRLLKPLCKQVFYSVSPEQENKPAGECISDTFTGLGPFGAILSAFRAVPEAAWLVVACDLPLLDEAALRELIKKRNPSRLATAFHNAQTGCPDPLVTIWEPRAYSVLLQFLAQACSSPREVLINSPIAEIQPSRPAVLRNANTPAARDVILQNLQK